METVLLKRGKGTILIFSATVFNSVGLSQTDTVPLTRSHTSSRWSKALSLPCVQWSSCDVAGKAKVTEEWSFSSVRSSDECAKAFRGKVLYLSIYVNLILNIDAAETHQPGSKKRDLPKMGKVNSQSVYYKVITRIYL